MKRMAIPSPAPLKRLSRPKYPQRLRITARDMDILRAVARFRFLSSEQIVSVVGGSPATLAVRLKKLFRNAYLDRPRNQHVQLAQFFDEGNRPLVYGLGRKGARLLAESGEGIDPRLDWTTKNRRATASFLAHTLETADAMIAFDLACRAAASVRLIDHYELLPFMPEATRKLRDPFRCRVEVRVKGQALPLPIAVVPDRLFSLAYPDGTRHNYALELDRGTMDIRAKRLAGKSSFRRKLIGYHEAWRARKHTERWNFKSFRILTLTSSEKRLATMLAAQREVTDGALPGLFLYTTRDRIAAHGVLGDAWINGAGAPVRLIP